MTKEAVLHLFHNNGQVGLTKHTVAQQLSITSQQALEHIVSLVEEGHLIQEGMVRDMTTMQSEPRFVPYSGETREQQVSENLRRVITSKLKGLTLKQLLALDGVIDTTIKKIK